MTTERKRKILIDALYLALIGAVLWFCLRYLAAWLLPFVLVAALIALPLGWRIRRRRGEHQPSRTVTEDDQEASSLSG